MMKSRLPTLAAACCLVLSDAPARGEFETWKNKEGKAAELEITGVDDGPVGTQIRFRTRADKEVVLKLEDLAVDEQARAKAWKPASSLKAAFAYVHSEESTKDTRVQIAFDLATPGTAMPSKSGKVSKIKATVGGKDLAIDKCTCVVDDGSSLYSAFTPGYDPSKRKRTVVIIAEGDFSGVTWKDCEFSADVEIPCGKSPKEVSDMFPLPKDESFETEVEKTLTPLKVSVSASSGPPMGGAEEGGKNGINHYRIFARAGKFQENGEDALGYDPVIQQVFVVRGKEHLVTISADKATDPIKVVVRYWSESYNVPLRLTKAATNKGGKPPADPFKDAPSDRKRGRGDNPFGD